MKTFPASISTPTEPGLSLNPGSQESDQPTSRPSGCSCSNGKASLGELGGSTALVLISRPPILTADSADHADGRTNKRINAPARSAVRPIAGAFGGDGFNRLEEFSIRRSDRSDQAHRAAGRFNHQARCLYPRDPRHPRLNCLGFSWFPSFRLKPQPIPGVNHQGLRRSLDRFRFSPKSVRPEDPRDRETGLAAKPGRSRWRRFRPRDDTGG